MLPHLKKQTSIAPRPSLLETFTGYVPKCKQSDAVQEHESTLRNRASAGSTPQRRTKVSFRLQSSQDDTLNKHETTTSSSKCDRTESRSAASATSVASVTVSSGSQTVASATAGLLPVITDDNLEELSNSSSVLNVADVPCVRMSAGDSSDISLLCAELFVDNNASFCDQLLDSCPLPDELPEAAGIVPDSSSFHYTQDIPESITDLSLDDFVDFDALLSYD